VLKNLYIIIKYFKAPEICWARVRDGSACYIFITNNICPQSITETHIIKYKNQSVALFSAFVKQHLFNLGQRSFFGTLRANNNKKYRVKCHRNVWLSLYFDLVPDKHNDHNIHKKDTDILAGSV